MKHTQYHWHHIIPKHAGGTDDPSNLVYLTVEEHAEAHRVLWEQYQRPHDKLAWLMLSGKTTEAEAARIELAKFTMTKRWEDPVQREAQSRRMKGNTIGVGRQWTPSSETKQRISDTQKERYANGAIHNRRGVPHTEETKQKIRDSKCGKPLSPEHRQKISQGGMGRKQTEHQKHRAREANAKMWRVVTPEGVVLIITNLRQFCRAHHLSQGNMITHGKTKGYSAQPYHSPE